MDAFIMESLDRAGKQAQINCEDPDKIIIVETIENRAGVGLVTKEMKGKYAFSK